MSGSQLGAELATRALKDLGPVIYNLYGSTEVALRDDRRAARI